MKLESTIEELKSTSGLRRSHRRSSLLRERESRGIVIQFPRRMAQIIPFPKPQPITDGAA